MSPGEQNSSTSIAIHLLIAQLTILCKLNFKKSQVELVNLTENIKFFKKDLFKFSCLF